MFSKNKKHELCFDSVLQCYYIYFCLIKINLLLVWYLGGGELKLEGKLWLGGYPPIPTLHDTLHQLFMLYTNEVWWAIRPMANYLCT